MKKIFIPAIFLLAFTLTATQDFPSTIKVPVTFYDHLALDDDAASCASKGYVEFNMCMNGTLQLNCVESELGPSGTPVFNSANPLSNGCPNCCWYNQYMDEWFIDNTTKGDERNLPPNMVIEDSLVFTHIGNGMYEFNKAQWFPLDGRGLVAAGAEQGLTAGHNYGFTMHMRRAFLYTGTDIDDNVFIFRGDDDVWVFINGHLVLDRGGIHTPVQEQFTFSEAKTVVEAAEGRALIIGTDSIVMDFFYTERREVEANIRITTNMPICPCSSRLPPPRATPSTCNFSSDTAVSLTHIFGASISYSLNGSEFGLYDGLPIRITEAATLRAYAHLEGWRNSDTISEHYSPIPGKSSLTLKNQDGTPLSILSAPEIGFIVNISVSYAEFSAVTLTMRTAAGDLEMISIDSSLNTGSKTLFSDTLHFRVDRFPSAGNGTIETSVQDTLFLYWVNPLDPTDIVSNAVPVIIPMVQSTLEANTATIEALNPGESGELIITLNDRVYNPTDSGYFLTVTTIPSASDSTSPDTETVFIFGSARPDIYLATLPVTRSGPPVPHDGTLQWPGQEMVYIRYQDPVEGDAYTLPIGPSVHTISPNPHEKPDGLLQIRRDRFSGMIRFYFQEGLPQKSLCIYDIHGRLLARSPRITGSVFSWAPRTGAAGILLCRIRIGSSEYLKTMAP